MIGELMIKQFEANCRGLTSNRRVVFDPRPLNRTLNLSTQTKNKQTRNMNIFLNSARYKTLMKQLQKEFDIALTK